MGKSRRRDAIPLVIAALLLLGFRPADPLPPGELERLPAAELARRLLDERTRLGAFRELSRRNGRTLLENLRHPEVVVCPQGPGEPPLYLVLAEFLPPNRARGPFGQGDLDALFPEEVPGPVGPLALRDQLLIEIVTTEGELLEAPGGDNVLSEGVVADLNGDGRIERVDHISYGVEGFDSVDVLRVWPVGRDTRPTLQVLFNWGADE